MHVSFPEIGVQVMRNEHKYGTINSLGGVSDPSQQIAKCISLPHLLLVPMKPHSSMVFNDLIFEWIVSTV